MYAVAILSKIREKYLNTEKNYTHILYRDTHCILYMWIMKKYVL